MYMRTKDRVLTNGAHTTHYRLLWMPVIVLLGVVLASLPWAPANPVHASSRKEQQAGAVLFHQKGCEACHGVNLAGTAKAPDLRTIGKKWKKSQIERQIVDGGFEMPPFQDALQKDEVKSLIAYLSTKRKIPKNP